MALRIGQTLRGQKGAYQLVEASKAATVFKAHLLPVVVKNPSLCDL
jgi:hypothetical protein